MEAITPQEGCQDHMIRRYGVGDIVVIIFGKYYQPQGVQETCPITQQMANHSFSQAAGAHRITCVARESQWGPGQTVMLTGLSERLGINQGE